MQAHDAFGALADKLFADHGHNPPIFFLRAARAAYDAYAEDPEGLAGLLASDSWRRQVVLRYYASSVRHERTLTLRMPARAYNDLAAAAARSNLPLPPKRTTSANTQALVAAISDNVRAWCEYRRTLLYAPVFAADPNDRTLLPWLRAPGLIISTADSQP